MTLHGPPREAFAERRAAVRAALQDAVLFLPEAPEAVYANDVHYTYRPDTNVRYLSGFEEPCALLLCSHGKEEDGFTLCARPRDDRSETWTGRRAGLEGARENYGADHAFPLDEVFAVLARQLRRCDRFYYAHSRDPRINERVLEAVHEANLERPRRGGDPLVMSDANALLAEFRLRKRPEEIERLREAGRVSAAAHTRLLETLRPGFTEYQAQAILEYEFRYGGCTGPAYGSICAGGAGATVLHYTANDRTLVDGELLLVDAAGEYGGYCADITRTFPVGAKYSAAQAALYDVVLEAQKLAVEAVRPGVAVEEVHKTTLRVLVQGLLDLGLLSGSLDDCLAKTAYTPYYMHNTSHWLGMDVHDAGSYRTGGASRLLEEGMVLTVEPGLYVRGDATVDEKYRGIGIRIEDDVLVTATGHEVLSAGVAKERGDIEKLRRRALASAKHAG
ncbi:MAG: aminopeptidase P N-terminal domain-containing protein [Candidatus Binatia bacterium]